MITYSAKEIKSAILRWSPKEIDFSADEFEQIKWEMILTDCFDHKGWLEERVFLRAMKQLCHEMVFAKYIDLETGKEHFIKIK